MISLYHLQILLARGELNVEKGIYGIYQPVETKVLTLGQGV